MSNPFFDHPILNSPYECPQRHWELDADGQPTQRVVENRRRAEFITPIPKPKKRKKAVQQPEMVFDEGKGLSTKEQQYDPTSIINQVRQNVDSWRSLPSPTQWQVSAETARLLQHWRHHKFGGIRPFFCQVEAVETAIWLIEVAPQSKSGKRVLGHLAGASRDANPELMRLALKLATGAGKTTVMAMIIAWQTINAVRRPASKHFTRGFLVVAPGLTIKDRLRVLQPNDPDSYYADRELVPHDLLDDVNRAKIVITNYHAFKLRERIELSAGGRSLLKGRTGDELDTTESEGQMLRRVMPDLMGIKNILVLNDEAHHCYREKPPEADDKELKGDDKKEAKKNTEAARLWISGLETVKRKLGLSRVIDLSATPFFLSGSGYAEGTLFPWTMSDFSLMDAIECGIVKLPRVPVAENIPGDKMPVYRNLWENIRKDMPRTGRGKGGELDPLKLPTRLLTALQALYGHYEQTFRLWEDKGIRVPPCFIIVCQNTAISKLVYDFISGFHRKNEDDTTTLENGRLALFRNFDETTGNPLPRPNTLLIDSQQLEAGDALDDTFRAMAADEIDRFRREKIERTGDAHSADNITDQELLREVMNTVGKHGQLGGSIRCVVSVSMLTEGWDANTVTHVLGIRAFGTQLLCEQVIGRALRRQSYELNEDGPDKGLFNVEYADVFGIPFDFTAKPVIAPPQPPRETVQVKAIRPERDALEIRFPRVEGYRVELPEERLTASFNDDSILVLDPDLVGPTENRNEGIIGEGVTITIEHLEDTRPSAVVFDLTKRLLYMWRDAGEQPGNLFGQLKRITKQWLDTCLVCKGGTFSRPTHVSGTGGHGLQPHHGWYHTRVGRPAPHQGAARPIQRHRVHPSCSVQHLPAPTAGIAVVRRPRTTSIGSFLTATGKPSFAGWPSRMRRLLPTPRITTLASKCRIATAQRAGSICLTSSCSWTMATAPTICCTWSSRFKGYRREDAKEKKSTMDTYWVPGVNNLKHYGRWAFAEFTDVYQIETDFTAKIEGDFNKMIDTATSPPAIEGR